MTRTVVRCLLCGTTLNPDVDDEVRNHALTGCRPRFWYWWPRQHPHPYALVALLTGLYLGSLVAVLLAGRS